MNPLDLTAQTSETVSRLDEEVRRLAAIVESSNDAIISETLDGTIISWNSAAERIYGFPASEVIGKHITEAIPSARDGEMLDLMLRVRRGEEVKSFEARRVSTDGTERDVSVNISPVRNDSGDVIGVSAIVRDITDRVTIEREMQGLARQQEAISQLGQQALAQTHGHLESLVQKATEIIQQTLDVEYVTAMQRLEDGQELLLFAGAGIDPARIGQSPIPTASDSLAGLIMRSRAPVVIEDLAADPRIEHLPPHFDQPVISGLGVVVRGPDRPYGVLKVLSTCRRTFTTEEVHFVEAVANILASAIARHIDYTLLGQRVDERTGELRMLLDISRVAAATLDLGPLVGVILDRIKGVVDYTGAALFVLDESGEGLNLLRYQGPIPQHTLAFRWSLATHDHAAEVINRARPLIINDVFSEEPLAKAFRRNAIADIGEVRDDFGSWMAVPMKLRDRVIGMLAIEHNQVNYFTGRHAELLLAVADHAAVAVENARLYEHARGLAALEERQKLARELHDSVSQALFGIGLGARTARTLLDRDPSKVAEPLDYVVSLAEAGLTEMRALIFELRPDALQQDGLVGILEKQAAALTARHKLGVKTELGTEPKAPLEIKEAVYRIAQEALNNVVKHARASTVTITLNEDDAGLALEIADDGIGFDPAAAFPGHLGLHSMRERAARLGAVIDMESAPGEGARLRVVVPPAM
jgi:PAS domain S-box-containing protein